MRLFVFLNLLMSDVICGAHRKPSCWVQGGFFLNGLLRLYYSSCVCAYLMHIDVLYFEEVLVLN